MGFFEVLGVRTIGVAKKVFRRVKHLNRIRILDI